MRPKTILKWDIFSIYFGKVKWDGLFGPPPPIWSSYHNTFSSLVVIILLLKMSNFLKIYLSKTLKVKEIMFFNAKILRI
jgi:hypothetical protein